MDEARKEVDPRILVQQQEGHGNLTAPDCWPIKSRRHEGTCDRRSAKRVNTYVDQTTETLEYTTSKEEIQPNFNSPTLSESTCQLLQTMSVSTENEVADIVHRS